MGIQPICKTWPNIDLLKAAIDLKIEHQGHQDLDFWPLSMCTHNPILKALTEILFWMIMSSRKSQSRLFKIK